MTWVIVIAILVAVLVYLFINNRKCNRKGKHVKINPVVEYEPSVEMSAASIKIPDLGLPADTDINSPEYARDLSALGDFLYHKYRNPSMVTKALKDVRDSLQNPTLILAHLQNDVRRYAEENVEKALS